MAILIVIFQGVEFRNPEKVTGGWLPLEAYDDREYDTRVPADWLKKKGAIQKEIKWIETNKNYFTSRQNFYFCPTLLSLL